MSGDMFDLLVEPEPDDDIARPSIEHQLVDDLVQHLKTPALEPEIMPADFKLPALVQFVPNMQLRVEVQRAADIASTIEVVGNDGIAKADASLVDVRGAIAAIEASFKDPKGRAFKLHSWISSKETEWVNIGKSVLKTVGDRIIAENKRLTDISKQQQQRDQAEADESVRLANARAAHQAQTSGAPQAVVEKLQQQAKTATAPPVAAASAPSAPKSSTIVSKWKTRFAGTVDEADAQPSIADLTDAQRLSVIQLCKAVIDGKCPISVFKDINWSYLDKRAEAEGRALVIPGIEVFEATGLRAKPGRRKS